MANDVAVAHVIGGTGYGSHVVLGRNDVLDTRERDVDIGRGVTGHNVGFAVVEGPRNQGVQGGSIVWRSKPVRGAGVDHGRLALESYTLGVHASVVQGDLPAVVINGLGVTELAFEFGTINPAKRDLPVVGGVRGSMKVHANNLLFQACLLDQNVHDGRSTESIRCHWPQAQDAIHRIVEEVVRRGRGHSKVEFHGIIGKADEIGCHGAVHLPGAIS